MRRKDYLMKWWDNIQESWYYHNLGWGWDTALCKKPAKTRLLVDFICHELKHTIKTLICHVRGHDIREDGYAGPDSGAMYFDCVRCGWHKTVHLY